MDDDEEVATADGGGGQARGPFTVFAPINAAWGALGIADAAALDTHYPDRNAEQIAVLKKILLHHVVGQQTLLVHDTVNAVPSLSPMSLIAHGASTTTMGDSPGNSITFGKTSKAHTHDDQNSPHKHEYVVTVKTTTPSSTGNGATGVATILDEDIL